MHVEIEALHFNASQRFLLRPSILISGPSSNLKGASK
jgi:hypothetical protein